MSSYFIAVASPSCASAMVMAAVKVVLPWSNVTNRADVYVRLVAFKMCLGHCGYPPSIRIPLFYFLPVRLHAVGAGDGNRTHVASLGSWSSTIELRPHVRTPRPDRAYFNSFPFPCQPISQRIPGVCETLHTTDSSRCQPPAGMPNPRPQIKTPRRRIPSSRDRAFPYSCSLRLIRRSSLPSPLRAACTG